MMSNFTKLIQVLWTINGALFLFSGFFVGELGTVLSVLSSLFVSIVALLSALLFVCLGFNRNLSKRVLLPQIFLLFWILSGLWPLSTVLGHYQALMLAAAGQFLCGIVVLFYTRHHKSLLQSKERFSSQGFHLGSFLRFWAASLLIFPVFLLFFGFSLATSYVDRTSGGFVRLGVDGLYMTERTYSRDATKIRLASMIHIGDQRYYDELAESMVSEKTLVLAEGVSDQSGLLREKFSYGGIADFLGLSAQEEMQIDGRVIDARQLARDDFRGSENGQPDITRADIDLRDFSRQTIAFINTLGSCLLNNNSFVDGFKCFNQWAQENMTPESNEIIMNDLVTKRNLVVLGHLASALNKYDTIVVPWGALHMVGIEAAVIDQGFTLLDSHERRSIDFSNVSFLELLKKIITTAD